ncbi:MAG: class I SAM-dependent methyltransferase [Pseudohongiellaceae bacterium]
MKHKAWHTSNYDEVLGLFNRLLSLKIIEMYDKNVWNERYATKEYLYGTQANSFLAENVDLLGGPVLSLAEGEGRNAVFMASRGLSVLGVDCSEVGLEKAESLAESRGVVIETEVVDLAEFQPEENHFGSVVSISAHLPGSIRRRLYPLIEKALKPKGILLLEAYSENQLARNTGGPKDIDMLMTVAKLHQEFPKLTPLLCRETERHVSEGKGHTGVASVVQYIARKEA